MARNPKNKQQKQQPIPTKKHLARLEREKRQTRWIIIVSAIVLVLVIGVIGYGALDQSVLQGYKTVASVNGEKINVTTFRAYTKYYRYTLIRSADQTYQLAQMFGQDPQTVISQLQNIQGEMDSLRAGQTSLDQMINDAIIRQEAKKRNITVSPQEVEAKLQAAMGYFPSGTPTPTVGPTMAPTSTDSPLQLTWMPPTAAPTNTPTPAPTITLPLTTTLTATPAFTPTPSATQVITPTAVPSITPTPTVYTTEAYKNNYATLVADFDKNYGISVDTLRSVIETSLYREKLQQEVIGQVDCSAEQVWAEHILVADEATANVVIDQLRAGEDWNKLAAAYSTDTSNKDKGGDLGWFGKGQMVAEFEQAAFNLKPGTITAVPIKTQFGYHIIRVLGHENRPLTPTECTQLSNTKFSDWLKTQHDASKIVQTDFWQTVVPLSPTLSPEITTILKNYAAQQPVPTPQGLPAQPTP